MIIDHTAEARARLLAEIGGNAASGISKQKIEDAVGSFENALGYGFKRAMIVAISVVFFVSVALLWISLYKVYVDEIGLLKSGLLKAADRIIDAKVIMALIAGTVTQVSVSFGAVMYFLFKAREQGGVEKIDSNAS